MKAKVLYPLGGAEYRIKLEYNIEQAEARRDALQQKLIDLVQPILDAELAVIAVKNQREPLAQQLDSILDAARAAQEPPDIDEVVPIVKAITALNSQIFEAESNLQRLKVQRMQAAIEKTTIENHIAALNTQDFNAWCADFTEDIAQNADVAVALIPGEISGVTINVLPAYESEDSGNPGKGAEWVRESHGQLTPPWSMSAPATFYNYAMQPGWQRWRPIHRHGTILSIDGDTAEVQIHDVRSTVRRFFEGAGVSAGLNVNRDNGITFLTCTARYMSCDMNAFIVGDEVIVELPNRDQEWTKPVIIGFKGQPRPCLQDIDGFSIIYCFYVGAGGKNYQVAYYEGEWIKNEVSDPLGGFTWFGKLGEAVCYGGLFSAGLRGVSVNNQLYGGSTYASTPRFVAAWRDPETEELRGVVATSYQSPPLTFRRRLELYRVNSNSRDLLDTLDFTTLNSSSQGYATVNADADRMIYHHSANSGDDTNNALIAITTDTLSLLGRVDGVPEDDTTTSTMVIEPIPNGKRHRDSPPPNGAGYPNGLVRYQELNGVAVFVKHSNTPKILYNTQKFWIKNRLSIGQWSESDGYVGSMNETINQDNRFVYDGNVLQEQNFINILDCAYDDPISVITGQMPGEAFGFSYDYDSVPFFASTGLSGANAWYTNPTVETMINTPNDPRDFGNSLFWGKVLYKSNFKFLFRDFPVFDINNVDPPGSLANTYFPLPGYGSEELSYEWVDDPANDMYNAVLPLARGSFVNFQMSYSYAAVTPDNGVLLSVIGATVDESGLLSLLGISDFSQLGIAGIGHMRVVDIP